jgi:hypothetical protein
LLSAGAVVALPGLRERPSPRGLVSVGQMFLAVRTGRRRLVNLLSALLVFGLFLPALVLVMPWFMPR